MSQNKYIEEVLKCFNMEGCKPIGTAFVVHLKLVKLTDEEYEGVKAKMQDLPYKEVVVSLMYSIVATRADLAYPMSVVVNQHMAKSGPKHWVKVKGIILYL